MQGMKKFMYVALICMIVMSLLGLAGCGKASDPKSLAKEIYELNQKSLDSLLKGGPGGAEKVAKEIAAIQKKIEALSDADKKIFTEEYAKLMGNALSPDDDKEDDEKDDAAEK